MVDNLILVKSLNTQSVLKQGKKLKFVGEGVEFKAYQNGNDSVLTLKNSNAQLPIQQEDEEGFDVEIDNILYGLQNVKLRGRILGRFRLDREGWRIQKLGELPRPLDLSRDGNFQLTDLEHGIYSFFHQSNPSMKTDVAAVGNVSTYEPDPNNPYDPMYDKLKDQIPLVSGQYKYSPWDWAFYITLSEGRDTLPRYEVHLIDNDADEEYIQDIDPDTDRDIRVDHSSSKNELYNDEYTIVFFYPLWGGNVVSSQTSFFAFP